MAGKHWVARQRLRVGYGFVNEGERFPVEVAGEPTSSLLALGHVEGGVGTEPADECVFAKSQADADAIIAKRTPAAAPAGGSSGSSSGAALPGGWKGLKLAELRELAASRGLETTGSKADLVARIGAS